MNHSPGRDEGVTALYNRHGYLPEKRHALDTWVAELARIVGGGAGGNVVALRGK